jgi:ketosteroid isomerase-like protein
MILLEGTMKTSLLAVLAATLFSFALACQRQAVPPAGPSGPSATSDVRADIAAIRALEDEWVRLYNAREFDTLMAVFYADNAVLMAPDAPARRGNDAILLSYRRDDELNAERVKSSVVEDVLVSGDLAIARGCDTGTTTSRKSGKPVPYDLKWVMAFERQADRTWKCVIEIWCENPTP